MKLITHVYVAGPIGANDAGRRARLDAGINAGLHLLMAGYVPQVPHLWAAACPADDVASYERWMEYDFALIDRCDALIRLPGHSPGADREVAHARARKIPVFFGVEAFLAQTVEVHEASS